MKHDDGSFRKLGWRLFVLLTLTGGLFYVTSPPAAKADTTACTDTYDSCKHGCDLQYPVGSNDPAGYAACLSICEANAGNAGCFSDGDQTKCDSLFYTCATIEENGGDGNGCYDDYASCEYAVFNVMRSKYTRLRGMPLEPDDPCYVSARSDYDACIAGGNYVCVSSLDGSILTGCCEGERNKAFAACNGDFGP
jgi:hypothetical protein